MNFDDLWNYVKGNSIIIYATFADKKVRGPLKPDKPELTEHRMKKARTIRFNNAGGDISIFEPSNNFISIDESAVKEIDDKGNYILVKCDHCEYKIEKNK